MLTRTEAIHVQVETYDALYKLLGKLFADKKVGTVDVCDKQSGGYEVTYEVNTENKPKHPDIITPNYYQLLSRRTQNEELRGEERCAHALFGLSSEVGEIMSIFQHVYQGKPVDKDRVIDECGDLCWFLCELLDVFHVDFSDVLKYNIDKLRKRYPEGFSTERSEKRHEQEK